MVLVIPIHHTGLSTRLRLERSVIYLIIEFIGILHPKLALQLSTNNNRRMHQINK